MAKKRAALTGLLAELPDATNVRNVPWHHKLRKSNPSLYEQIVEVVDLFNADDPLVARKFSGAAGLSRWLLTHLEPLGFTPGDTTIRRFIAERRDKHAKS